MNSIEISYNENGVLIKGDAQVLEKAQKGNGNLSPESVSIEGMKVDVDMLAKIHDKALITGPVYDGDVLAGYPIAKQYAALKQAFLHQQELVRIEANKPKEKHEPAINSQTIKPVDA